MDRIRPAGYAPRILTTDLPLLQVGKLPEVVDRVKVADLHEPSPNALHHLAPSLQAPAPVGLPLEQIARAKCVGPELEDTAKVSGRCRGPEAKLLHQ